MGVHAAFWVTSLAGVLGRDSVCLLNGLCCRLGYVCLLNGLCCCHGLHDAHAQDCLLPLNLGVAVVHKPHVGPTVFVKHIAISLQLPALL